MLARWEKVEAACAAEQIRARGEKPMTDPPGYVDGVHYTSHVERIRDLKRAGRTGEARALLLKCIDATEAEDRLRGGGVAPGYYEDLAVLYRKEGRFTEEVAILERFEKQRKGLGVLPDKLAVRLIKARELRRRASPSQAHPAP